MNLSKRSDLLLAGLAIIVILVSGLFVTTNSSAPVVEQTRQTPLEREFLPIFDGLGRLSRSPDAHISAQVYENMRRGVLAGHANRAVLDLANSAGGTDGLLCSNFVVDGVDLKQLSDAHGVVTFLLTSWGHGYSPHMKSHATVKLQTQDLMIKEIACLS